MIQRPRSPEQYRPLQNTDGLRQHNEAHQCQPWPNGGRTSDRLLCPNICRAGILDPNEPAFARSKFRGSRFAQSMQSQLQHCVGEDAFDHILIEVLFRQGFRRGNKALQYQDSQNAVVGCKPTAPVPDAVRHFKRHCLGVQNFDLKNSLYS